MKKIFHTPAFKIFALCLVIIAIFSAYKVYDANKKITMVSQNASGDYVLMYQYLAENPDINELFGGCYINDSKQLVALFVKDFFKQEQDFDKVMEYAHILESTDFSYIELEALSDEIMQIVREFRAQDTNQDSVINYISTWCIYDNLNRIGISIREIDDDKIAEFKEIFGDSKAFLFEEGFYATFT